VRLAALNLRRISRVDMEDPGLDPRIPGILCFHLNLRVSHFTLMSSESGIDVTPMCAM